MRVTGALLFIGAFIVGEAKAVTLSCSEEWRANMHYSRGLRENLSIECRGSDGQKYQVDYRGYGPGFHENLDLTLMIHCPSRDPTGEYYTSSKGVSLLLTGGCQVSLKKGVPLPCFSWFVGHGGLGLHYTIGRMTIQKLD